MSSFATSARSSLGKSSFAFLGKSSFAASLRPAFGRPGASHAASPAPRGPHSAGSGLERSGVRSAGFTASVTHGIASLAAGSRGRAIRNMDLNALPYLQERRQSSGQGGDVEHAAGPVAEARTVSQGSASGSEERTMTPVIPLMVGDAEFWGNLEESPGAALQPLGFYTPPPQSPQPVMFNTPQQYWGSEMLREAASLQETDGPVEEIMGDEVRVGSPSVNRRVAFGGGKSLMDSMPEAADVFSSEDGAEGAAEPKKKSKGRVGFVSVASELRNSMLRRAPINLPKEATPVKGSLRATSSISKDDSAPPVGKGGRSMVRLGSTLRASMVDKLLPASRRNLSLKHTGRAIKTYSQNVAAIRAAVIVMFPPRRSKSLAVLSELLEESAYRKLTRYVLSTMRSEADLQEVLWVCGTVNRLHKAGAGGSSAESEQLVGLGALIAMLQSVDDPRAEAAMRRARAHGAMPPLDPSDLAHMIDLLRLTGADRISAAVRLRIDTLRLGAGDDDERNKSWKLKRMLTSVRKEVHERAKDEPAQKPHANLKATANLVRVANAFRIDLPAAGVAGEDGEARALDALEALLFGALDGPKAGPFRWLVRRPALPRVWEWVAFCAAPWKRALLSAVASQAAAEFPDRAVRQWLQDAVLFEQRQAMAAAARAQSGNVLHMVGHMGAQVASFTQHVVQDAISSTRRRMNLVAMAAGRIPEASHGPSPAKAVDARSAFRTAASSRSMHRAVADLTDEEEEGSEGGDGEIFAAPAATWAASRPASRPAAMATTAMVGDLTVVDSPKTHAPGLGPLQLAENSRGQGGGDEGTDDGDEGLLLGVDSEAAPAGDGSQGKGPAAEDAATPVGGGEASTSATEGGESETAAASAGSKEEEAPKTRPTIKAAAKGKPAKALSPAAAAGRGGVVSKGSRGQGTGRGKGSASSAAKGPAANAPAKGTRGKGPAGNAATANGRPTKTTTGDAAAKGEVAKIPAIDSATKGTSAKAPAGSAPATGRTTKTTTGNASAKGAAAKIPASDSAAKGTSSKAPAGSADPKKTAAKTATGNPAAKGEAAKTPARDSNAKGTSAKAPAGSADAKGTAAKATTGNPAAKGRGAGKTSTVPPGGGRSGERAGAGRGRASGGRRGRG